MTDQQNEGGVEKPIEEEMLAGEGGPQAEPWQDELPPEDDFQDIQDVEEPLEEGLVEEMPMDGDEAVYHDKARGKTILFAVIGVGLLLVGGMAFLQFGGGEDTGPQLAVPLGEVVDVSKIKAPPAEETMEEAVTPKTGEADLSALYNAAKRQTQTEGMLAIPSGESGSAEEDKSSLGTSTEVVTLSGTGEEPDPSKIAKVEELPMPSLQPEPAFQKTAAVPEKEKAIPAPLPVKLPQAEVKKEGPVEEEMAPLEATKEIALSATEPTAKTESVPSVTSKGQEASLKAQIQKLQTELNDARVQNKELENRLMLTQKEETGSDSKELREQISALTAELDEMREELSKARAGAEKAKKEMAQRKETVKKPKKVVQKKKAAPPKEKKKTVEAAPIAPAPESGAWVLRAATPEAAWVSKGSYAAELRRIAVGETLPGIGRIQAIRQNGASWEVVGTAGTLR